MNNIYFSELRNELIVIIAKYLLFIINISKAYLPLVAKWLKVESKSKDFKGESVITSPLFYHTLKQFYIEENDMLLIQCNNENK